jgi:endoglucanase
MKKQFTLTLLFLYGLFVQGPVHAGSEASADIRVNQIGYYPNAPKVAAVIGASAGSFALLNSATGDTVYHGNLSAEKLWPHSDERVKLADFSAFTGEGAFILSVPGLGDSHPFDIRPFVHQAVAAASLKAFYFARASMELTETYAGPWKRKMGHPDTKVRVHASAATASRPVNTLIASPWGWYDAGDYNKYIVNSGITMHTLLLLFEQFPEYCSNLKVRIPEGEYGLPDLLEEALWNLRWMMTMQDPDDGGVYHKCTNENFDGFSMPANCTTPRYVVQKSTAAAFDFAAVMAQAYRVIGPRMPYSWAPTVIDSCLDAAVRAWNWARRNPDVLYNQTEMNKVYSPKINTGEYGDGNVSDERDWAAMELFVTTGQDSFLTAADPFRDSNTGIPGWPSVRTLGFYSVFQNRKNLTPGSVDTLALRNRLIGLADALKTSMSASAYGIVMGRQSNDFGWGCNSQAANQGIALIQAFRATGDSTYLCAALSNLDYLLGKNATGYSFVTGYGDKTPMHPHHRPSEADGVKDPVPGFLVGGPNPGQQDGCGGYPSKLPAKSYVDATCSYASNEVCINWNAPMVYLTWAIEAILSPDGKPDLTGVRGKNIEMPDRIAIAWNYPNPFNAFTTIRFVLSQPSPVTLSVFDMEGRRISALLDGKKFGAGSHEVRFDATSLPSGIYVYRIEADGQRMTGRMALVK